MRVATRLLIYPISRHVAPRARMRSLQLSHRALHTTATRSFPDSANDAKALSATIHAYSADSVDLSHGSNKIPRPQGVIDTRLRDAMGLGEPDPTGTKKALYDRYLLSVRRCADENLTFDTTYGEAPPEDLQRVFAAVRVAEPGLSRYENDWATAEILRQCFSHKRRSKNSGARALAEMKREGKPKACSPPRLTEMIRKPAGNFSRQRSRLRLQDAMGLGGSDPDGSKAAIYNHYVAAVRLSMDRARLSYDMPFNKVPRSEISQIFATAQSLQPDLAKYEDDWATYEILRRNYYSRRHRSSKIVHLPAETKSLSLIPKPQGIFPHIKPLFKLRDAMGLGAPDPDRSKKALYIACREAVRYSADVANFGTSMKQVSRAQLEDVFASARKIQPELARYEDDWASAEILRQHVNSRRQYQNRLNRERRMVEADALERIAPP